MFAKGLRAQRAGRVAPRRGGAKRRAAALGAAQRREAPPQAAERRARHKVCFSAFNFPPIIEKQKVLTGTSAGIRPDLWPGQPLGLKLHGKHLKYLRYHYKLPVDSHINALSHCISLSRYSRTIVLRPYGSTRCVPMHSETRQKLALYALKSRYPRRRSGSKAATSRRCVARCVAIGQSVTAATGDMARIKVGGETWRRRCGQR